MRILKWSKLWFIATLFAVLGLVASPALAFGCCCDADTQFAAQRNGNKVQQVSAHQEVQAQISSHAATKSDLMPPCDGHCHMAAMAGAQPETSPTQVAPTKVATALPPSHVTERCTCTRTGNDLVGLSAPGFASFVPVAASLPVCQNVLVAPRSCVLLCFASPATLPRGPDYATLPSRGPPVLAFS